MLTPQRPRSGSSARTLSPDPSRLTQAAEWPLPDTCRHEPGPPAPDADRATSARAKSSVCGSETGCLAEAQSTSTAPAPPTAPTRAMDLLRAAAPHRCRLLWEASQPAARRPPLTPGCVSLVPPASRVSVRAAAADVALPPTVAATSMPRDDRSFASTRAAAAGRMLPPTPSCVTLEPSVCTSVRGQAVGAPLPPGSAMTREEGYTPSEVSSVTDDVRPSPALLALELLHLLRRIDGAGMLAPDETRRLAGALPPPDSAELGGLLSRLAGPPPLPPPPDPPPPPPPQPLPPQPEQCYSPPRLTPVILSPLPASPHAHEAQLAAPHAQAPPAVSPHARELPSAVSPTREVPGMSPPAREAPLAVSPPAREAPLAASPRTRTSPPRPPAPASAPPWCCSPPRSVPSDRRWQPPASLPPPPQPRPAPFRALAPRSVSPSPAPPEAAAQRSLSTLSWPNASRSPPSSSRSRTEARLPPPGAARVVWDLAKLPNGCSATPGGESLWRTAPLSGTPQAQWLTCGADSQLTPGGLSVVEWHLSLPSPDCVVGVAQPPADPSAVLFGPVASPRESGWGVGVSHTGDLYRVGQREPFARIEPSRGGDRMRITVDFQRGSVRLTRNGVGIYESAGSERDGAGIAAAPLLPYACLGPSAALDGVRVTLRPVAKPAQGTQNTPRTHALSSFYC